MNLIKYNNQLLPEELIDQDYIINVTKEVAFIETSKESIKQTYDRLKSALASGSSIIAYCYKCDSEMNLYVKLSELVDGFVPSSEVSHISPDNTAIYTPLVESRVGLYIRCVVKSIEFDGKSISVILSRKKQITKVKNKYHNELKQNMTVDGVVVALNQNEAIISIGGDVFGILGIGNICRVYINSPTEILHINQKVSVIIHKLIKEPDNIKYEFSRKELLPSFNDIDKFFKVGDVVIGTIKNTMATGVFINLNESFRGMARLKNNKVYTNGEKVKVIIKKIDYDKQRINLDIKL